MDRTVDTIAATELELYLQNDGVIYRQRYLPVAQNLERHYRAENYDQGRAVVGMRHAVDAGAKGYACEHADGSAWFDLFDVPTRDAVALSLVLQLEAEWALGNSYL
jgi:hypothetical protein